MSRSFVRALKPRQTPPHTRTRAPFAGGPERQTASGALRRPLTALAERPQRTTQGAHRPTPARPSPHSLQPPRAAQCRYISAGAGPAAAAAGASRSRGQVRARAQGRLGSLFGAAPPAAAPAGGAWAAGAAAVSLPGRPRPRPRRQRRSRRRARARAGGSCGRVGPGRCRPASQPARQRPLCRGWCAARGGRRFARGQMAGGQAVTL